MPVTARRRTARDHRLETLETMRQLDVLPEGNWQEFMELALIVGLTLQGIAEALPCAPSTVSRWHAGKSSPPQFARIPMKDHLLVLAERQFA